MTPPPRREELRPHLREEALAPQAAVVVRGGPATATKLAEHARRAHEAYVLDGEPIGAVSVFAALDDIGPSSLEGLLRRFASYRWVHLPTVAILESAGLVLLPSFVRPHYTVRLPRVDPAEVARLLVALGRPALNPYHGGRQPGRR